MASKSKKKKRYSSAKRKQTIKGVSGKKNKKTNEFQGGVPKDSPHYPVISDSEVANLWLGKVAWMRQKNKNLSDGEKLKTVIVSKLIDWERTITKQIGGPRSHIGYNLAKYSWDPYHKDPNQTYETEDLIQYKNTLLLLPIDADDALINITRYSPTVLKENLSAILNERRQSGRWRAGTPKYNPIKYTDKHYKFFADHNIDTFAQNETTSKHGFFPSSKCLDEKVTIIQVGLDTQWYEEPASSSAVSDEFPYGEPINPLASATGEYNTYGVLRSELGASSLEDQLSINLSETSKRTTPPDPYAELQAATDRERSSPSIHELEL